MQIEKLLCWVLPVAFTACMPINDGGGGVTSPSPPPANAIVEVTGDVPCSGSFTLATQAEVTANHDAACSALVTWAIARLADGGTMDGPGYGCGSRSDDTRAAGNAVCTQTTRVGDGVQLTFSMGSGDLPCAPGSGLVTPAQARTNQSALCGQLGTWDIVRLDGGGSMDGPGYGCTIRDFDSRPLGNTLCQ
jgi:hypothetical protein